MLPKNAIYYCPTIDSDRYRIVRQKGNDVTIRNIEGTEYTVHPLTLTMEV